MSCDTNTALDALRRGHVTWQQLHPRVRDRLMVRGYREQRGYCVNGVPEGMTPLQHGERKRQNTWRSRPAGT